MFCWELILIHLSRMKRKHFKEEKISIISFTLIPTWVVHLPWCPLAKAPYWAMTSLLTMFGPICVRYEYIIFFGWVGGCILKIKQCCQKEFYRVGGPSFSMRLFLLSCHTGIYFLTIQLFPTLKIDLSHQGPFWQILLSSSTITKSWAFPLCPHLGGTW